jgi:C4-dicarboxylate-specific signal transduction histidine kinase
MDDLTRPMVGVRIHGVGEYSVNLAALFVPGHSGQLQEVMLNLIRNAIDAMDSTTDRARVLRVRTERDGREAIVVSVEDSGSGIDPRTFHSIFDAFVTTKPHGMGLGLAICLMPTGPCGSITDH